EARKLRRELLQPILYPCVLLLTAILVTPASTLVTEGTGGYLRAVAWPVLAALLVGAGVVALARLRRQSVGQLVGGGPLLGRGSRLLEGSDFLYTLGTCLESGLAQPEAFGKAARCVHDPDLRAFGERLQAEALAGRLRPEHLASAGLFGSFASQI